MCKYFEMNTYIRMNKTNYQLGHCLYRWVQSAKVRSSSSRCYMTKYYYWCFVIGIHNFVDLKRMILFSERKN